MKVAVRFWRGGPVTKPEVELVVVLPAKTHAYAVRFGRPVWRSFTERYAGQYGIPSRYRYIGPVALIHRVHTTYPRLN